MKSLSAKTIFLVLALSLAVGSLANSYSTSHSGPELALPPIFIALALVSAGTVIWLALQVTKYQDRKRRASAAKTMNPLLAARTAVLAQATALTGAAVVGWHFALLIYNLSLFSSRAAWSPLLVVVVDVIAGTMMLLAGLWAENKCKIPPEDGDGAGGSLTDNLENPGYVARKSEH